MINNSVIRNCRKGVPVISTMLDSNVIGKIKIKNIYNNWQGETIKELSKKIEGNPYHLRIGLPHIDEQLRSDRVFLITNYLSFNPMTKSIEKRQLIPLRLMTTLYIGQSIAEQQTDSKVYVDGNISAQDIILTYKNEKQSMVAKLAKMEAVIQNMQEQIVMLKQQLKSPIYNQTI